MYVKQNQYVNLTDFGFQGPRGGASPEMVFSPFLLEPVNNYYTSIGMYRDTYRINSGEHFYNPALCAQKCNELTQHNRANKVNTPPYINGAYPKCNMFTIFEDWISGEPQSVVCTFFQSSWDSEHAHVKFGGLPDGRNITANSFKTYQRLDYNFSPICVLKSCQGPQYYAGGDCSGWGPGYCQRQNGTDLRARAHISSEALPNS